MARRPRGFTLVELVLVLVLVSLVSVVALPRLVDATEWRLRAYADDATSLLLSARRQALAQRRPVVVTVAADGLSADYVAGGRIAALPCPSALPGCVAETAARSVTFNASHSGGTQTSTGAALTVTLQAGSHRRVLSVETETGLVRLLSSS